MASSSNGIPLPVSTEDDGWEGRSWEFEMVQPHDPMLHEASIALYSMAKNPTVDPNTAMRSLSFHNRLDEEDTSSDILFKGDALTSYLAKALEICEDADSLDRENLRDHIRRRLMDTIRGCTPRLRTELNEDGEDKKDTILIVADKLQSSSVSPHQTTNTKYRVPMRHLAHLLRSVLDSDDPEVFIAANTGSGTTDESDHSQWLHRTHFLNTLDRLSTESGDIVCEPGMCMVVDNVPSLVAKEFCYFLEQQHQFAKLFVAGVLHEGHQSGGADQVLRATTRLSYEYFKTWSASKTYGQAIAVTVFSTSPMNTTRSRGLTSACEQWLRHVSQHAWQLHPGDRFMVGCVAEEQSMDFDRLFLLGLWAMTMLKTGCCGETLSSEG